MLSRPVAESIALAASVTLDRLHRPRDRDAANVHEGPNEPAEAEIERVAVDQRARDSYGDPPEATEEGAEGIAVVVARRVLNRVVFRRLPKSTGADYLMCEPEARGGDAYERLECSGIGEGRESAMSRLRTKIEQLATHPELPRGHAVVTDFGATPVEIRVGSWP